MADEEKGNAEASTLAVPTITDGRRLSTSSAKSIASVDKLVDDLFVAGQPDSTPKERMAWYVLPLATATSQSTSSLSTPCQILRAPSTVYKGPPTPKALPKDENMLQFIQSLLFRGLSICCQELPFLDKIQLVSLTKLSTFSLNPRTTPLSKAMSLTPSLPFTSICLACSVHIAHTGTCMIGLTLYIIKWLLVHFSHC